MILSKKLEKEKKPQFSEIGRTGVQFFSGLVSGEEYLSDLEGESGLAVYDRMRRSDGQVRGTLFAITLPIRQANFYIDPPTDDKQDVEIAEIIQKNLLEEMSITWDDLIRQILTYLIFGYSIFEKVWHFSDGFIKLKKLAPRIQKSLYKWKLDKEGGLAGITQYAQSLDNNFEYYDIPIDKLIVFINEKEGSNFDGISVLRSAYKHWYIKDELYKVDAIGHDRFASGIPYAKEPENANPKDTVRVSTILENLYSREKSWVQMPFGWDIGILEKIGANDSIMSSISHHNEEISKNILTQFINLGTTKSGSRALGESFEELFLLSINAICEYIEDNMNRYVIKQMVDYNWTVKEYPKLRHGKIVLNVSKWLEGIAKIGGGNILHSDIEIENHVRKTLGFPETKEENIVEPVIEPVIKPEKIPDEYVEEKLHDVKLREYHRRRKLKDYEEVLADFTLIENSLNTGIEKYETQVIRIRKQQSEQLSHDVMKKKPEKVQVGYIGKMADRIFDEMKRMFEKGKDHVQQELINQKKQIGKKFSYDDFLNVDLLDETSILEYLRKKSTADAVIMADKIKTEAFFTMYSQGIGKDDKALYDSIYSGLLAKSTADIKKTASSAINQAYGMGRQQAAAGYKEEIEYAVYSALLDGRACSNCVSKDGVKHTVHDSEFMTPNVDCAGSALLCRCINVYKLKGMEKDFLTRSKADYEIDKAGIESGKIDYKDMRERYEIEK